MWLIYSHYSCCSCPTQTNLSQKVMKKVGSCLPVWNEYSLKDFLKDPKRFLFPMTPTPCLPHLHICLSLAVFKTATIQKGLWTEHLPSNSPSTDKLMPTPTWVSKSKQNLFHITLGLSEFQNCLNLFEYAYIYSVIFFAVLWHILMYHDHHFMSIKIYIIVSMLHTFLPHIDFISFNTWILE
jgi:hypothetical protein